ncbi:MAG TPA: HD domain-containing protein [Flavisolibacter sp.]
MPQSFEKIQQHFIETFGHKLSPRLTYHNIEHILDVVHQAQRIGEQEQVTGEEMYLLRIAALYHDCGFIQIYRGHEEVSCRIAQETLPQFDITEEQIDRVCGMIMATRVPQTPLNHLERIICDADLDYLGREDFFEIADLLFQEMREYGFVTGKKEWDLIQQEFFQTHRYFTRSNALMRDPRKFEHLEIIRGRLASCPPR